MYSQELMMMAAKQHHKELQRQAEIERMLLKKRRDAGKLFAQRTGRALIRVGQRLLQT